MAFRSDIWQVFRFISRFIVIAVIAGVLFGIGIALPVRAVEAGEPPPPRAPASGSSSLTAETEAQESQESSEELEWYERLELGGDFRSRYEGFYQEGRQTRNRSRLRLRLRLSAQVNKDVRFRLRVASGDSGTPVSTNQTFTSFFRPKPFNLDRAFISYNPTEASALTLGMGKFGPPQTRTQLIFDDDLNFEGGWEQISWSPSSGVNVNLIAMQTAVNEVSRGADSYMLMGYGEIGFEGERAGFQVSVADYGWGNPDSIVPGHLDGPLAAILTNELARDAQGRAVGYASDFNVIDVIGEATVQTGKPGYPLRLLAQFAHNTRAANDRDSGWWFEAEYGSPGASRTWGVAYTYGWLEQDLTPSAFVFSDIAGTNLRLNMIETSYVPRAGLSLDVTLHLTKRLVVRDPAPNNLLSRLHVAAVIRF